MAGQKSGNTADRVWKLAEPVVRDYGLEIWDVRFVKEGASWFLRIFIDKPEGVTIDDCENVSRSIDPLLDEQDFIPGSYYLEVSSPGLGRALTRDLHFRLMLGERILVKLIRARDGQREFRGTLLNMSPDGTIHLETEDGEIEIKKSDTAFVRLLDDEDIGGFVQ